MRIVLRAIAGLIGGAILGVLLAWAIIAGLDVLGWLDHGGDGLSGAVAFFGLAALLALLLGAGGAVWGIVTGGRQRGDNL